MRARAGYTMLELLAVMAIIALLVGIVVTVGQGVQERSRRALARAELAALATALEQYRAHYGSYPWVPDPIPQALGPAAEPEEILFNALCGNVGPKSDAPLENKGRTFVELARFAVVDSQTLPGVDDPEPVANAFLDPWGNRYVYRYRASAATEDPWKSPAFLLLSAGPDGEFNLGATGSGLISDIPDDAVNADNLYAGR